MRIDSRNFPDGHKLNVKILNVQGALITKGQMNSGTIYDMAVGPLQKGIYILAIEENKTVIYSQKILKN